MEPIAAAYDTFLAAYPAYGGTASLDRLRSADYGRLDQLGHTYLDYTGGGLYALSQVRRHHDLLQARVFGNPHSDNPTSLESLHLVEEARAAVLAFFNAPSAEYDVVFTSNASGALKLVGESFPFGPGGRYLLTYDNHNSVNGVREFARYRGATVTYIPVTPPELRIEPAAVLAELDRGKPGAPKLFAYPAQSNFSGVQHPLTWVSEARARGWRVVLDSAAFAPTNRLDLRLVQPDFVPLSFYKMFGYPTGIGALICRREALAELKRPWFAGGTITVASVQGEGWHHLAPGHAGFEDGTVDYLGLPAVVFGLEHLTAANLDLIHDRVVSLTGWLIGRMRALRHAGGAPLTRIFGPCDLAHRGGTVAFYLLDPDGLPYDVRSIETDAAAALISLRTGCFCNPGDGEVAHAIAREDMARCFEGRQAPVTFEDCSRTLTERGGPAPNTIRVSLGLASNFADVYRLLAFLEGYRDRPGDLPRG